MEEAVNKIGFGVFQVLLSLFSGAIMVRNCTKIITVYCTYAFVCILAGRSPRSDDIGNIISCFEV